MNYVVREYEETGGKVNPPFDLIVAGFRGSIGSVFTLLLILHSEGCIHTTHEMEGRFWLFRSFGPGFFYLFIFFFSFCV